MSQPLVLNSVERNVRQIAGQLVNVFKLRIGLVMMLTALVGMLVTPGPAPGMTQHIVLALSILLAAAAAGAFNQYYETDIDALMQRTRYRPFVTGVFEKNTAWLFIIALLLITGVGGAAFVLNAISALYVFLGAFFYAIVYTVWLKRRSVWNIVIGGASGSFAVLAGAAAVDPTPGAVPILLAIVLFLWTPSHFWSLAIAKREDYARAGVPMLPVVAGDAHTARITLINTVALVAFSLMPFYYGMGWLYLLGAALGGGYFIYRNSLMVLNPDSRTAILCFLASLLQLVCLLVAAVLDVYLSGL